eukprot:scaffold2236_cov385-Prasinococcus_capsulatus_cf.AAC.13
MALREAHETRDAWCADFTPDRFLMNSDWRHIEQARVCEVAQQLVREYSPWIQAAGSRIQSVEGFFGWYLHVFVG